MPGAVTLDNRTLALPPGQDVSLMVRVRNLGQIVDGFMADVLGQPGAWATVNPPETRLFPQTEGAIQITFRQPENAPPVAGVYPFAVRIRSREDPEWVAIEEGTAEIPAHVELGVDIRPKTSSGRSTGKHEVIVDNLGNTPVYVHVEGDDPDDLMRFHVDPPDVQLEPRTAAVFELRAKLVRRPPGGTPRVPFVVSVYGDGRPAATTDGGFSPRKFPWKPIALLVVALGALGVGAYVLTRTDVVSQATQGETTTLATTTTAVAETTTSAAQATTTTESGQNNGNGGGGPVGNRLDDPQVLFASDRDGDFDLLMADTDGSNAVTLTNNDVFDADPSFSPDGRRVVFVSARDGNDDLFRLNLDDCDPSNAATCEPDRLTASDEDERFPDVSSDGDLVVFSRNVADPGSRDTDFDLFVLDLQSGEEEPLATLPGDQSRPQFSPDGQLVAFDSETRGGLVVSVVDQAGTVTTIGQAPGFDFKSPQWVDDDTLALVRSSGDVGELLQVDLGSRTAGLPLFDEPTLDLFAVSRDGERVVFQSGDNLFVADIDGGDAEQLTRDDGFNFQADLFEPN